eukprot:COSAG04_NODE_3239_length_3016_cov_33.006171_3_plen_261_part_00
MARRICRLVAVAAWASAAAALEPQSVARTLSQFAASLSSERSGGGTPPVPTIDMPPQFTAKFANENNGTGVINQTLPVRVTQIFEGSVWGSMPTKQFRYSGSSTILLDGKKVSSDSVTLVMDGSRGLKYTYLPDKAAKDKGLNTVVCLMSRLTDSELARSASGSDDPTTFAGEVFVADRVTEAFYDAAIAKPAGSLLFIDPFRTEPVATMKFDGTGNSSIVVYMDMQPVALKPTEFEMPKGVTCKPGQVNVPEALAAWQW